MVAQEGTEIVTPGQRLGSAHEFIGGEGTYVRQTHVIASRTGLMLVNKNDEDVSEETLWKTFFFAS
jgi:exosome complex RNA-binding protein Csl4